MGKIGLDKHIFITGTDTDIGKTVVSSIIAKGLNASYWKIIQTGDDSDRSFVSNTAGLESNKILNEAYRLKLPLSPYAASNAENLEIDIDKILLRFSEINSESLVAEGAGGVMVPIKRGYFMSDLIKDLGMNALVVARSGLGTLNHTFLTVEHLRSRGVNISGIVLNGPVNEENQKIIEELTDIDTVSIPLFNLDNKKLILEIFEQNFYTI